MKSFICKKMIKIDCCRELLQSFSMQHTKYLGSKQFTTFMKTFNAVFKVFQALFRTSRAIKVLLS